MRHFIQYHNPDKMGHVHDHTSDELSIFTNKPFGLLTGLLGNTIWLIGGEGRPRSYGLLSTFLVDEIGESDDAVFRWYASGTEGRRFHPPIPIERDPWFVGFLHRQANFSLGLRELQEPDVARLRLLATRSRDDNTVLVLRAGPAAQAGAAE
jgi:hypothetical protein